ncbi:MAG: hypothetical protein IT208_03065 [Chthonomonadales bacterium]|nr:hypothetical protein [Chthonomonadales bacterium]
MIRVELSAAEISIEPGNTAQLSVAITNRQEHDDHVSLEIEGIDVEWYALPVPALNVAAGETQSARVLFRIARSSECQAGTYPFVVRARGMESGESGVQQAALIIQPFSALQVEMNPRRASSTFLRHAQVFDVTIGNLGNRPETLDLYASDPEDACAYEYETDRVIIKPGHSETVPLLVEPVTRPLLGSSRLYGFTVTARSVEDSYVSTNAHGQLERHPLLSTTAAIAILLLVIAVGGWWLLRPRPVQLHSFVANPMQVRAGDTVTLSWDVSNLGVGSFITPGNRPVDKPVGSMAVTPEETTTYTLVARGGGKETRSSVSVAVTPRPPAPRARIATFAATQRRIHLGDSVTLSWKVDGAVALVLNPIGPLNPRLDTSRQVTPEETTRYELAARGADGDVKTRTLEITVVPPNVSTADIQGFRARPASITAGEPSTLTWSVSNAMAVEIDNGIGTNLEARGKFDVSPQQTTTYTLRVTDSKGNVVSKQATVTVKPAPPPPPPDEQVPEPIAPAAPPPATLR